MRWMVATCRQGHDVSNLRRHVIVSHPCLSGVCDGNGLLPYSIDCVRFHSVVWKALFKIVDLAKFNPTYTCQITEIEQSLHVWIV